MATGICWTSLCPKTVAAGAPWGWPHAQLLLSACWPQTTVYSFSFLVSTSSLPRAGSPGRCAPAERKSPTKISILTTCYRCNACHSTHASCHCTFCRVIQMDRSSNNANGKVQCVACASGEVLRVMVLPGRSTSSVFRVGATCGSAIFV